jgi:glutaredoxin
MKTSVPVQAQLFIAPGCPHCPGVLQIMSELIKSGEIAELDVTNIAAAPDKAQQYNVRSVPWIKIGPFELTGTHSKSELQTWISRVHSPTGMIDYFNELFAQGELKKVSAVVKKDPDLLTTLLEMVGDKDTPLGSRIGISAIFEELKGKKILSTLIPQLEELIGSENKSIRNDACYYLGLSENPAVIPLIQSLSAKADADMFETIDDALEIIYQANH